MPFGVGEPKVYVKECCNPECKKTFTTTCVRGKFCSQTCGNTFHKIERAKKREEQYQRKHGLSIDLAEARKKGMSYGQYKVWEARQNEQQLYKHKTAIE